MKRLLGVIVTAVLISAKAMAGAGMVVVYDGSGKLCEEGGPEYPVVRQTSDEAIASLNEWLEERPQKVATKQSWPSSEIAFTGYIKFCGAEERRRYFSALLEHLKAPQKNERVFVLLLLHSRSNLLLEMVEKNIGASSSEEVFRGNLEKAKRLVVFQRKSPEPYPTETVVKRLDKRLKREAAAPRH